ncbi:MAG: hypothetical protein JOZ10_02235, partial [Acidobacteria bacterium]|nr:hypothetical protein [Acidobacteriota bacterium]
MVKTAPGQKTLQGATTIQLSDVQVGDRVLVRGAGADGGGPISASTVVIMKQGDVANRQQQEIQDWQRRGAGGIVRSIDSASGAIVVAAGLNRTMTIQTSPQTEFLRYAPDSVKFSDARKSTISDIKAGDQLRARGNRSADGQQITAETVISGSFRNIAGTVTAVDAASNTLTVTDLIAKQPATVKVTADTQMRKIPPEMGQRIAAFLRRGAGGQQGNGTPGAQSAQPVGVGTGLRGGGQPGMSGGQGGPGGQNGPPDFQRMIRAMPAATLADLQKGDAVMIVTTQGSAGEPVTALTLLSGVEPILTAAPTQTSAANLLSGWSMGGGEGEPQ